MPTPDVGLAPPPPPDVAAQMKPTAPGGAAGGMDIGALLAGLAGPSAPPIGPDITPKVMQIQPILDQIARQVPALGPDVDRLNVELKSRMGGLPAALAGLAGGVPPLANGAAGGLGPPTAPSPAAPPLPPGPAGPEAAGPGSFAAAPPMAPAPIAPVAPGPPPPMPMNPAAEMGAMDTAMQIEIQLPPIGKDDPTLMPYIQGFIARMREEVPKVVQGETEAVAPPPQVAPTESMLAKIPVTY